MHLSNELHQQILDDEITPLEFQDIIKNTKIFIFCKKLVEHLIKEGVEDQTARTMVSLINVKHESLDDSWNEEDERVVRVFAFVMAHSLFAFGSVIGYSGFMNMVERSEVHI
jgi:hypothetical protein